MNIFTMLNCIQMNTEDFREWLNNEIKLRGFSLAELARLSGVSKGAISNILNGHRNPTAESLEGIAHALGLPAETVYRKAGLLPEGDFRQVAAEVLGYKLDELTPNQLDELIEYIEFMQRRDARSGGKRTSYVKPVREGEAPPEVVKGKS